MCDKEFKELVKIAVEKLKDKSVLKLLQVDASYQKDSNNEGNAENAFNGLDLTEKQRAVCQRLLNCRDKQDFEYDTHVYCRTDRCVSYYGGIVPRKMGYGEDKGSLITKEQIRRIIKQNKFLHSRLV